MTSIWGRLQGALFPAAALRRALIAAEAGRLNEVFPVLARHASKSNAKAQYWVGKAYLEGRGVPQSRATAMSWLQRAAEAGQRDAQSVLAALYLTGASPVAGASVFADEGKTEPNFEQAMRWARPAAEAGAADAQALLAYLLTSGPESMRDLPQADAWYAKSAAAGCAQGSMGLALSILRDAKDDDDRARAAKEMAKAADARLPLGVYLMGTMLEAAVGVQQDLTASARMYEQSAALGVRSGIARWGLALLEGRGIPKDPAKGESFLRRAALAGW